jgi:hypothetical protein
VRFRFGAALVLVVVGGIVVWLVLRDHKSSSSSNPNAAAVTVEQLQALAASVNHPVFWSGPRAGSTYELTQSPNGAIFIRYLPSGAKVGSKDRYPTVATYPFPGAFAALQAVAKQSGSTAVNLPNGGLGVISSSNPTSIHAAYPNVDYQVEVFDPDAGAALQGMQSLTYFGSLKSGSTPPPSKPRAASVASLKALARDLGHPIYWAGPRKGYTYEVTQASNGNVYVRYLPAGVAVGSPDEYFSVGTYPYTGAFAAIQALGKQKNAESLTLKGGGRAVIDAQHRENVHAAFPGSDYEIEVFDPSAARVRRVVSSGQVRPIAG